MWGERGRKIGYHQKPPADQKRKASAGNRNRERSIKAKTVQRKGHNGKGGRPHEKRRRGREIHKQQLQKYLGALERCKLLRTETTGTSAPSCPHIPEQKVPAFKKTV